MLPVSSLLLKTFSPKWRCVNTVQAQLGIQRAGGVACWSHTCVHSQPHPPGLPFAGSGSAPGLVVRRHSGADAVGCTPPHKIAAACDLAGCWM